MKAPLGIARLVPTKRYAVFVFFAMKKLSKHELERS